LISPLNFFVMFFDRKGPLGKPCTCTDYY
jgi:hypothetical protein